jgi:uncharacterized membrane protein
MTVLFALVASAFIGISDFLGGTASRVGSPLAVTAVLQLAALATLTPIAAVLGASGLTVHDAGLGAASGLATSVAYVGFFTAMARGRISIVVPVSAAVTALLPAIVGTAEGTPLSTLATGGILCALVAIPLVAYEPGETEQGGETEGSAATEGSGTSEGSGTTGGSGTTEQWSGARQVLVSVLCGGGFGAYFVCVGHTHRSAGLWPTVANLAVAAAVITPAAVRRGVMPDLGPARRPAIAGGVALGAADTALTTALQQGPLTVASVLGNLYPLVTISLGVILLGERVRPWHAVGIVLAMAGVTMIAAG